MEEYVLKWKSMSWDGRVCLICQIHYSQLVSENLITGLVSKKTHGPVCMREQITLACGLFLWILLCPDFLQNVTRYVIEAWNLVQEKKIWKKVKKERRREEEKYVASWLAGFIFAQNVFSLAHLQGSMIVEPLHLNLDVIDPSQSYQVLFCRRPCSGVQVGCSVGVCVCVSVLVHGHVFVHTQHVFRDIHHTCPLFPCHNSTSTPEKPLLWKFDFAKFTIVVWRLLFPFSTVKEHILISDRDAVIVAQFRFLCIKITLCTELEPYCSTHKHTPVGK